MSWLEKRRVDACLSKTIELAYTHSTDNATIHEVRLREYADGDSLCSDWSVVDSNWPVLADGEIHTPILCGKCEHTLKANEARNVWIQFKHSHVIQAMSYNDANAGKSVTWYGAESLGGWKC